jgi:hypothetical protein
MDRAVTIDKTHTESHPGYWLIMINLCTFDEIQADCLVIELESEYCAWSGPSTDH